jgi:hypothetical protein
MVERRRCGAVRGGAGPCLNGRHTGIPGAKEGAAFNRMGAGPGIPWCGAVPPGRAEVRGRCGGGAGAAFKG